MKYFKVFNWFVFSVTLGTEKRSAESLLMWLHYCSSGTSGHFLVNVPKTGVIFSRLVRYIIQFPITNIGLMSSVYVFPLYYKCWDVWKKHSMSKDYIKSNKIVLFKQLLNWTNYYLTCNNETRANLGFCTLKTCLSTR